MSNLKSKRIFSIDLCCVIGIILMIGFHYFNISGFEFAPISSASSIPALFVRWLCMTGLPLIIMQNGAVFFRKEFSFKAYKGLIKMLYFFVISFIIVTICSTEKLSVIETLNTFYTFQGSEFAIIYVGLLLAGPFLANLYKSLPDKRTKHILLIVMCLFTSIPHVSVIFGVRILPQAFTILYPITIFFFGAYIYEYRKTFNALNFTVMLFCLCMAQAILSYSSSLNSDLHTFSCDILNHYGSIFNVISTACLFAILLKIRCHIPVIRNFIKYLANSILPIIMISWIFETKISKILIGQTNITESNVLKFFPLYLLITSALCLISSSIIQAPYNIIYNIVKGNSEIITEDNSNELYIQQPNTIQQPVDRVNPPTEVFNVVHSENKIPESIGSENPVVELQTYNEPVPTIDIFTSKESREPFFYDQNQQEIPIRKYPSHEKPQTYEPQQEYYVPKTEPRYAKESAKPIPTKKKTPTLENILNEQSKPVQKESDSIDELIKLISSNRRSK